MIRRAGQWLNRGTDEPLSAITIVKAFLAAALVLLLILLGVGMSTNPARLTYTIDARSDAVSLDTDARDEVPFVLRLPPGQIFWETLDPVEFIPVDETQPTRRPTSIAISGPARIRLSSPAPGTLEVIAESRTDTRAVVRAYDGTQRIDTADAMPIRYLFRCLGEDACGMLAEITALIEADRMLAGESNTAWVEPTGEGMPAQHQPVLVGGVIRASSPTGLGTRATLMETPLDYGDVVELHPLDGNLLLGTVSFRPAETDPGRLSLVAHGVMNEVTVSRYGGAYDISVPQWERVTNEPFWRFSWATLVAVVLPLNLILYFAELFAIGRQQRKPQPAPAPSQPGDTA